MTRPSLHVEGLLLWEARLGSLHEGREVPGSKGGGAHAQVLSLSWGPFCDVLSAKGGHVGEPNVKGPLSGGEKVAL